MLRRTKPPVTTAVVLIPWLVACNGDRAQDKLEASPSASPTTTASAAPPPTASPRLAATAAPMPSDAPVATEPPVGTAPPPGRLGPVPQGKVKHLSVGNGHACAVTATDELACWSEPDTIFELGTVPTGKFRSVYVGMSSSCAQRLDGEVVCFGGRRVTDPAPKGAIAELCHDNRPCVRRPDGQAECAGKRGPQPLGKIQPGSLACGSSYSCALDLQGKIQCVVVDRVMAHGSEFMPPADWTIPTASFRRVFSGYQHGCALRADHSAVCWGRDTQGETRPPPGPFLTLALGEKLSCGLRPNGDVVCWGGRPAGPYSGPFKAVHVTTHKDRLNSVCAVRRDDTVACWDF